MTTIGNLKITNVSGAASLNFGPAIHKGHQANMKIETGEYIIGDEFNFGCPPEEDEEDNNNNGNGNENDKKKYDEMLEEDEDEIQIIDSVLEDKYEINNDDAIYNKKAKKEKRWKLVEGKWKRLDQIDTADE